MRTIKLLEWKAQSRAGKHEATTPLGTYTLMELPLGCAVSFHSRQEPFRTISDNPGVMFEQAKGLAQSDFERRTHVWYASLGLSTVTS
jgi:hypothetical protein